MSTRQQREPRFLLRLPQSMLTHIDAAAKARYRTSTAEILSRLLASMEGESIDEHGVIVVRSPANTNEKRGGRNS